jgi:hypothetical protein
VLVPETRILILALGINAGLRGIPVETVETNLTKMVERARTRKVEVLLRNGDATGARLQLHH